MKNENRKHKKGQTWRTNSVSARVHTKTQSSRARFDISSALAVLDPTLCSGRLIHSEVPKGLSILGPANYQTPIVTAAHSFHTTNSTNNHTRRNFPSHRTLWLQHNSSVLRTNPRSLSQTPKPHLSTHKDSPLHPHSNTYIKFNLFHEYQCCSKPDVANLKLFLTSQCVSHTPSITS
jgi:hypothetical protein